MPAGGRPALRVGVLVPCRDEEAVLPRKLANLARVAWPTEGRRHVVCIVDDGSADATAEVAAAAVAAQRAHAPEAPYALRCERNRRAAGKAGAIATGLEALAQADVDLVVLSDADVVFEPDGLVKLVAAFDADPALAMACGAQTFVRDLAADGSPAGADGGALVPAGGFYDRWTAVVRRLESRSGRLFSVHGQMLAWRAALSLTPTPGVAADDIDLMLQVRARGGQVRLVPGAGFLEQKTPRGSLRERQALRRARAYFQVVRRRPEAAASGALGRVDRLQLLLYRTLPAAAPFLGALALVALLVAAFVVGGAGALALTALALGAVLLVPVVRRLGALLGVIARAWWTERREPISDRWEMERG